VYHEKALDLVIADLLKVMRNGACLSQLIVKGQHRLQYAACNPVKNDMVGAISLYIIRSFFHVNLCVIMQEV
jgi:hypothetical protein